MHLAHLVHLAHTHGGNHHEARLQVVHRGQGVCLPETGVQLHHRHEVAHLRLERLASLNIDVLPGTAGTVRNVAGVVRVNCALAVFHGLRPVADLVHVVAFGIEHHQRQVNVHALIPEAEEANHAGGRQVHRRGVVAAHAVQGGAGTAGVQRHDCIAHLLGQVDGGLGKATRQANLDQALQQVQHRRAVLARRNHGCDTGLGQVHALRGGRLSLLSRSRGTLSASRALGNRGVRVRQAGVTVKERAQRVRDTRVLHEVLNPRDALRVAARIVSHLPVLLHRHRVGGALLRRVRERVTLQGHQVANLHQDGCGNARRHGGERIKDDLLAGARGGVDAVARRLKSTQGAHQLARKHARTRGEQTCHVLRIPGCVGAVHQRFEAVHLAAVQVISPAAQRGQRGVVAGVNRLDEALVHLCIGRAVVAGADRVSLQYPVEQVRDAGAFATTQLQARCDAQAQVTHRAVETQARVCGGESERLLHSVQTLSVFGVQAGGDEHAVLAAGVLWSGSRQRVMLGKETAQRHKVALVGLVVRLLLTEQLLVEGTRHDQGVLHAADHLQGSAVAFHGREVGAAHRLLPLVGHVVLGQAAKNALGAVRVVVRVGEVVHDLLGVALLVGERQGAQIKVAAEHAAGAVPVFVGPDGCEQGEFVGAGVQRLGEGLRAEGQTAIAQDGYSPQVGVECAGVVQVVNARVVRAVVGAVQVGEDVHAVAAHQDEAHEGAEALGRFAVKVGGFVEVG